MTSTKMPPPYGALPGFLITATLAAFAIAQPLYDLISQNPAFLIAHHATPSDMLLLVGGLSVAVPAILIAIQGAARILGKRAWWLVHSAMLVGLVALLALTVISRWTAIPDIATLDLALLLGIAFFVALVRSRSLQTVAALAGIGIVLFPLLFVFDPRIQPFLAPPASTLELPLVSATAPVIVLVLDELPVTSLLDEERQIDRHRYPNFARLANTSTWYRNATTVSDDTVAGAVPAILTGQYPQAGLNYRETGTSLFTLLGGSYDLHVTETYTRVCPEELCPTATLTSERRSQLFQDLLVVFAHIALPQGMRATLPDISQGWKNFETRKLSASEQRSKRLAKLWDSRAAWMDQLVDNVEPSATPSLYFLHILLPHLPWTFLPNGNSYELDARGLYGVPGVSKERWGNDIWAIEQGYQRHLLQLGYVDRELGRLLDALQRQNMFDDTLLVLVADHGVSFRANDARRPLTNTNAADILRIPLFIKAPDQGAGVIDDAPVETVDILPTVAGLLGVAVPWEVDGLPASDSQVAQRHTRRVYQQNRRPKPVLTNISRAGFDKMDDGLVRKLALFGSGNDPRLFHHGKYAKLVGRDLSTLPVASADSNSPRLLLDPIQTGNGSPWAITGKLTLPRAERNNHHLVAVQGERICATTRSYANSGTEAAFVFFVGPACNLDTDANVDVLLVNTTSAAPALSRLHKRDIE